MYVTASSDGSLKVIKMCGCTFKFMCHIGSSFIIANFWFKRLLLYKKGSLVLLLFSLSGLGWCQ